MKVRIFWRRSDERDFREERSALLDFGRLPTVGEYVGDEPHPSSYYLVQMVVHLTHPKSEHVAELYCVVTDAIETLQDLVGDD